MKKVRAQKRESLILIILLVMLIGGSIFSYPGFSYALGSSSSSMGSALGGLQESMALYQQGDSQGALMKKAETCPFRQMYISGAAKEGSMAYNIGKKVDELYRSMGGTSTEITESDCAICNVLAGAVGGEGYQQYQQQLASGKSSGAASNSGTTANSSGVTVYTAPGCISCAQVKKLLQEKNVPFTEIDAIKDTAAGRKMIAMTGQTGVPVTVINGQYVVGYKPDEIERLLSTSAAPAQTGAQKAGATQTATQKTNTSAKSAAQSGTQKTSTSSSSGGMLGSLFGGRGMFNGGSTSAAGNGKTLSVATTTYNTTYTLADETKKDLAITIWYPSSGNAVAVTDAPYPLVVFSHGMLLGTATQSRFITSGLASKGYIVCATTHEDSIYYRGKKDASSLTQGFNDRPLDVQAIITEMLRLNNTSSSIFYGMIAEDAIGVMGHSLGGWTTELVCGGTPPGQESLVDKRVKAGVLFDPASISANFSNIHIPMMCFFGGNSFMKSHGNGSIYESLNPPKYVVTVSGLSHMDFTDIGSVKPGAQAVLKYTIAFFDRYLKGDLSAEEILQTQDQTFSSYQYEVGEKNRAGEAGGGEIGAGWQEIPAYGRELEEIGMWRETPPYSVAPGRTTENSSNKAVDFSAMLGTTGNSSDDSGSGDIFSGSPAENMKTEAPEETEGSVYCEDGVCYVVYPNPGKTQPEKQSEKQSETQSGTKPETQQKTAPSVSAIAQEVLELVNQHRAARGVAALEMEPTLTRLAAEHSEDMARAGVGPNHNGSAQRFQTIRNTLGGYGGSVAENACSSFDYGNNIAKQAVELWLGGPGHRANIENSKFTLTGIGVARSSQGEYYFTQIFFEGGQVLQTIVDIALSDNTHKESTITQNKTVLSEKKASVKEKSVEEIAGDLVNLITKKYPQFQEDVVRLTELAVTHSQDMAQKDQGTSNEGNQNRFNEINAAIPGHYYSENVAGPYKYSSNLAKNVFTLWRTRGDYEAIIRRQQPDSIVHVGIGIAKSSAGNYYFTQITWGTGQ